MIEHTDTALAHSVQALCQNLSQNPMWVQGTGGNISWKDNINLWVKASGMALADAHRKSIFVPIVRQHLADKLRLEDFNFTDWKTQTVGLRPSIETWLHALMPQRIVVHLHAIDALVHLVDMHAENLLRQRLPTDGAWKYLDYHKPGADLARAVHVALQQNPTCDLLFLANHGIVLGAQTPEEIPRRLTSLCQQLACPPCVSSLLKEAMPSQAILSQVGYQPVAAQDLHALATNPTLLARVAHAWALYPDHVVFLGDHPVIITETDHVTKIMNACKKTPPFIFVENNGVFASPKTHTHHLAQLRCYYDVITRMTSNSVPRPLTAHQIDALCHWEAEHHRQTLVEKARLFKT